MKIPNQIPTAKFKEVIDEVVKFAFHEDFKPFEVIIIYHTEEVLELSKNHRVSLEFIIPTMRFDMTGRIFARKQIKLESPYDDAKEQNQIKKFSEFLYSFYGFKKPKK